MVFKINKKRNGKNANKDLDQLWTDIRAGKSYALSNLFKLSYSWLFNYGYKIIPREAFIEDSIQELFLNIWKRRSDINEAYSVKSYLFTSFRRIIFRRLTKQRNRTKRNYDYEQNMLEDLLNTEDQIIHSEMDRELKDQLRLAIKVLTKRQKEAVHLKFYKGFSHDEIASIMEINKQSVYNHVSEAINNMQNFIEPGKVGIGF